MQKYKHITFGISMLNNIFPSNASIVKWIALVPSIGLSESNLKLYTNFELFKGKK